MEDHQQRKGGKLALRGFTPFPYTIAAGLMILAAVLTFFTKAPAKKTMPVVAETKLAPTLQAAD